MIRYPGSKAKITKQIIRTFPMHLVSPLWQSQARQIEYREPFFGGGAIGLALIRLLPNRCSLWLNDKDYSMACLWQAVYAEPDALSAKIRKFKPSVEAFERFKQEDGDRSLDAVRLGFQKLALHQISWSGLGAMAGGPLGGVQQRSEYNVDCRWNAARHESDVREISGELRRFAEVKITSGDFAPLIDGAPSHAFIYADPPYFEKGPELYKHSMSVADHERLADALRSCEAPWALSYDDHPAIRKLYSWAHVDSVELTYTVGAAGGPKRRKNSEIVLTPKHESERGAA